MIFYSHVSLCLWIEAFSFLLNRLSSSSIAFDMPCSKIYKTHSDYNLLRVFGSKCFPYVWDSRTNKFNLKTYLCMFVGCNEIYKGASFDETSFPFKLNSDLSSHSHANLGL